MNELQNELPVEAPVERPKRKRRVHSAEFKSEMIAQCLQGDQSLASIALVNGLNSTMLRKWVREHEQGAGPTFVPVKIDASSPQQASLESGLIEVTMSGGRVRVQGQVDPQALHAVLMALR